MFITNLIDANDSPIGQYAGSTFILFYVFIFYFATWIVVSFANLFVFVFFYSFFDEIHVCKQNFSDLSKRASSFF